MTINRLPMNFLDNPRMSFSRSSLHLLLKGAICYVMLKYVISKHFIFVEKRPKDKKKKIKTAKQKQDLASIASYWYTQTHIVIKPFSFQTLFAYSMSQRNQSNNNFNPKYVQNYLRKYPSTLQMHPDSCWIYLLSAHFFSSFQKTTKTVES